AVTSAARTGNVGDGKLFVYELSKVVRIRTGESDNDAL
ncbi:MAG: P-II family nitrogen regulator, partial [Planctomycetota bacterium]